MTQLSMHWPPQEENGTSPSLTILPEQSLTITQAVSNMPS